MTTLTSAEQAREIVEAYNLANFKPEIRKLAQDYITVLAERDKLLVRDADWRKLGAESPHTMGVVLEASLEGYRELKAERDRLRSKLEARSAYEESVRTVIQANLESWNEPTDGLETMGHYTGALLAYCDRLEAELANCQRDLAAGKEAK